MTVEHAPLGRHRIAVLAFVGTLALVALVSPLAVLFLEQEQATAAEQNELDQQRAKIAAAPAAKQALADARTHLGAFGGFLHASNPALAQAALQNEVKAILEANKAVLHSAQPGSVTTQTGVDKVSVQFDAVAPASGLRDILYALETHAPYLFISDIQISGTPSTAQSGQNEELELRMTVAAFRTGGAI